MMRSKRGFKASQGIGRSISIARKETADSDNDDLSSEHTLSYHVEPNKEKLIL
jgi:hypothetical protein